jgi:hypothetical protein
MLGAIKVLNNIQIPMPAPIRHMTCARYQANLPMPSQASTFKPHPSVPAVTGKILPSIDLETNLVPFSCPFDYVRLPSPDVHFVCPMSPVGPTFYAQDILQASLRIGSIQTMKVISPTKKRSAVTIKSLKRKLLVIGLEGTPSLG